jgi:DNA-binding transcriptional regulator YiaG
VSDARYVVTLKRALELAGGEHELAAILGTSSRVLRKWLSGRQQPPVSKYVAALQLVSAADKSSGT